jgi:hypothetical protein
MTDTLRWQLLGRLGYCMVGKVEVVVVDEGRGFGSQLNSLKHAESKCPWHGPMRLRVHYFEYSCQCQIQAVLLEQAPAHLRTSSR